MKAKELTKNATTGIIGVIGILTIFHFFGGGLIWVAGLILLGISQLLLTCMQVDQHIMDMCGWCIFAITYIIAVVATFLEFNN